MRAQKTTENSIIIKKSLQLTVEEGRDEITFNHEVVNLI